MADAVITISVNEYSRLCKLETTNPTQVYEKFVSTNWSGPATVEYAAIGMGGEAGEVLNEIKKEMRDGSIRQEYVRDELGDTLHYMVRVARLYGYTLEDIMVANIKKLEARKRDEATAKCLGPC